MCEALSVTVAAYSAAPPDHEDSGLLGWVTLVLNGCLQLDSIAVRLTETSELALSYPARRGRFPFVRPLDEVTRREIERQVFGQLRAGEVAA